MRRQTVSTNFRRKETWGDTKSKSGVGRRIVVRPVGPNVKLDDLKKHFAPREGLEGVTILDNVAFIQFRRPVAASSAISTFNRTSFSGSDIQVNFYDERKEKGPQARKPIFKDEPLESIFAGPSERRRNRSRSPIESHRSRRRHIDDYREGSHYQGANNHSLAANNSKSPPAMTTDDITSIFANYGDDRFDQTSSAQAQSAQHNSTFNNTSNLPGDIAFLLDYIVKTRTARSLSTIQLGKLISFLEYEKMAVAGTERAHYAKQVLVNPNIQQHPQIVEQHQQPFPQQAVVAIQNTQPSMTQDEISQQREQPQQNQDEQDSRPMDTTMSTNEFSHPVAQQIDEMAKLIRDAMRK